MTIAEMRMQALDMAFASLADHDEPLCHIAAIQVAEEIMAYILNGVAPPPHEVEVGLSDDKETILFFDAFKNKYGSN